SFFRLRPRLISNVGRAIERAFHPIMLGCLAAGSRGWSWFDRGRLLLGRCAGLRRFFLVPFLPNEEGTADCRNCDERDQAAHVIFRSMMRASCFAVLLAQ